MTNKQPLTSNQKSARVETIIEGLQTLEIWTRNHPNGTCEAVHYKVLDLLDKARSLAR